MKLFNIIFILIIIGIITAVLIAEGQTCTKETCKSQNQIILQISNPYSFDVDAEIKCDWNNEKQAFDYHERLVFPADQITKIEIPKAQRQCEIWPHVQLFE